MLWAVENPSEIRNMTESRYIEGKPKQHATPRISHCHQNSTLRNKIAQWSLVNGFWSVVESRCDVCDTRLYWMLRGHSPLSMTLCTPFYRQLLPNHFLLTTAYLPHSSLSSKLTTAANPTPLSRLNCNRPFCLPVRWLRPKRWIL